MGNPKQHYFSADTAHRGRVALCGAMTSRATTSKPDVTCLMCVKMVRSGTRPKF